MTKKFNNLQLKPTLAEAFEVGKREGSKEAYTELKHMISGNISQDALRTYIDVRLKMILDLKIDNPFKQKD